jgi:hypothetical protein
VPVGAQGINICSSRPLLASLESSRRPLV